jgi:hypothetical protein
LIAASAAWRTSSSGTRGPCSCWSGPVLLVLAPIGYGVVVTFGLLSLVLIPALLAWKAVGDERKDG